MSADLDDRLLRELARPLVARFAPAEEELLFALLSDAYFADPGRYPENGATRQGPLAFGLPEATVLLTPILLAAFNEAIAYVVNQAMAAGGRVTRRSLRRLLRSRQQRPAGPTEPASASDGEELVLTAAQWAEISRIVERTARRGGVDADLARLIAAAVVGEGRTGDDGR